MNGKKKKTSRKKTSKKTTRKKEEKTEKIMRITLKTANRETLGRLAREFRLDIGGGGPRRLPDGFIQTEAYVSEKLLPRIRKAGGNVNVIEDATKVGKARQKEVGRGDRYQRGKIAPRGLGRKE